MYIYIYTHKSTCLQVYVLARLYSPKKVAVEVCMRASVQQQHGVFNRKLLVSALWSDDDRVLGRQKSEFDEGEMIIYHIYIYMCVLLHKHHEITWGEWWQQPPRSIHFHTPYIKASSREVWKLAFLLGVDPAMSCNINLTVGSQGHRKYQKI